MNTLGICLVQKQDIRAGDTGSFGGGGGEAPLSLPIIWSRMIIHGNGILIIRFKLANSVAFICYEKKYRPTLYWTEITQCQSSIAWFRNNYDRRFIIAKLKYSLFEVKHRLVTSSWPYTILQSWSVMNVIMLRLTFNSDYLLCRRLYAFVKNNAYTLLQTTFWTCKASRFLLPSVRNR